MTSLSVWIYTEGWLNLKGPQINLLSSLMMNHRMLLNMIIVTCKPCPLLSWKSLLLMSWNVKTLAAWEEVRYSMLHIVTESGAMQSGQKCLLCEKHVVLRCVNVVQLHSTVKGASSTFINM